MKQNHSLAPIISLARRSAYNEPNKKQYRRAALRWLKVLAENLNLENRSFDIRFNPGGIAVSGDAILHHENFYVSICEGGAYWRTVKGRKDYGGGNNQWIYGYGYSVNDEDLLSNIRKVLAPL